MNSMNNYLEEMGITQWQATYSLPGARVILEFETYALRRAGDNRWVGQLDLQVLPAATPSEQAIKDLLTAMLAAVGCQCERMTTTLENPVRLLMGLPMIQHILHTTQEIDTLRANNPRPNNLWVTYHPADLLANPANKRKAWDDLRAWSNALPK